MEIFKGIFKGIGTGILYSLCTGIGLFILVSFGTCCGKCTYGIPEKTFNTYLENIIVFCMVIGFIIGIIEKVSEAVQIYQKEKRKEEEEIRKNTEAREKTEREQRQQFATEFNRKASRIVDLCNSNRDDGDKITLQPNYKGISLQSELWNTLNDVSIPLQKLENIVSEFSTKKEDK